MTNTLIIDLEPEELPSKGSTVRASGDPEPPTSATAPLGSFYDRWATRESERGEDGHVDYIGLSEGGRDLAVVDWGSERIVPSNLKRHAALARSAVSPMTHQPGW